MKISEMIAEQKARAKKKAKEERAHLRMLEQVKAALGDIEPSNVSPQVCYGAIAGVTFGSEYQPYSKPENRLTMEQVAELLDRYPPAPLWKISNGCTAFRPDWDVSDEEAMRDNAEKVWGVVLRNNSVVNESQKVEWYTEVNGVRLEIKAILQPSAFPVRVRVDARRDHRTGKVLEIMSCTLEQNPAFPGHFWMDQRIRWAAGSSEYPNPFSLHWLAIDDSQGAGKAWLEQICGITE